MGVQVIPIPTEVVSHSLPFPFPILFYSHSHGIPGPIGNPIPMHISISHQQFRKLLYVSPSTPFQTIGRYVSATTYLLLPIVNKTGV